jgi:hypothetical protein
MLTENIRSSGVDVFDRRTESAGESHFRNGHSQAPVRAVVNGCHQAGLN